LSKAPNIMSNFNESWITRGPLDDRKALLSKRTWVQFWLWSSAIRNFIAACLVKSIVTSLVLPPWHLQFITSLCLSSHFALKCDDKQNKCIVSKMCPNVQIKCELHVRMKLYRAAYSLSDAHSHFFPNQNNSCYLILNNKRSIARQYIGMNVRIGEEYLAGTLKEFARNIISNIVCTLACNLLQPRNLNTKFGTRRSEVKLYGLQNDSEVAVRLQPIKSLLEQPMYHNCASLCSQCEMKENAEKIYISLLFVYYRNWKQHAADCLFGSNRNFRAGFGRLQPWNCYTRRLRLQ